MKYRVVGWTEYDDTSVDEADCSEAAYQAILADIREHGYDFSGWDHQESINGAPVLNDGCKRLFSQRGFGGLMAEAHGNRSRMGYSIYAFRYNPEDVWVMPPIERSFDFDFVPEEDLNETITATVDDEALAAAATGKVTLPNLPELTYLDEGDTLVLTAPAGSASFLVKEITRERDFDIDFMTRLHYPSDEDVQSGEYRRLEKIFEDAPDVIRLKLAPIE